MSFGAGSHRLAHGFRDDRRLGEHHYVRGRRARHGSLGQPMYRAARSDEVTVGEDRSGPQRCEHVRDFGRSLRLAEQVALALVAIDRC